MLRLGCSSATAEEIAQEAMLSVWRKAGLFDPGRASAATWIFTIARNRRIEQSGASAIPALLPDPPEDTDPADLPDRIFARAQRDNSVQVALSRLPVEQEALIRHAFFEDKPHTAIEKELGVPLGTVKSRLRRALARLRTSLEDPT